MPSENSALAHTFPVTIPDPEPELVDKFVIARVFGVSPRTIENWVAQRKIPFLRIGRRTMKFKIADVRRALDRKTVKEIS
jgi:excisionase family DNA binding protein